MNEFHPEQLVEHLFRRIRGDFNLGMREYLTAIELVRSDWSIANPDDLKQALKPLWCHSRKEQRWFATYWEEAMLAQQQSLLRQDKMPSSEEATLPSVPPKRADFPLPTEQVIPPPASTPATSLKPEAEPQLSPYPVRSPLMPTDVDTSIDLENYLPVSRRAMRYTWRYLRRPIADEPRDILDLEATVVQAARDGFFLQPVYRCRDTNHAHLLMFIDQGGSMMPFHRFTRDLVETAHEERSLEHVSIYYFYNAPVQYVYSNSKLSQLVALDEALSHCDNDTSVLIVSDAGAMRGYRKLERFRSMTTFLTQLKQRTSFIGWLNPTPTERWDGTTAEMMSYLVSMEQMDEDGFSNVIDTIRGQA